MLIAVSICILVLAVPSHSSTDYTGHKVYAMVPRNERQIRYLKKLQNMADGPLDFWSPPTRVGKTVHILVPPSCSPNLEEKLNSIEITYHILTENLQAWINAEREENPEDEGKNALSGEFPLDIYHNFESIMNHIDFLEKQHPTLISIKTFGKTYEGNPIKAVKVGKVGENKPAVWIDAGIHAREWIAPATAIYIINMFLTDYEKGGNKTVPRLLNKFDWYIIPVVNPDGYIHTWTENRMWRKNRSPNENSECVGTDPNRNFDSYFGGAGTNTNPCKESYLGKHAFSEAESRAIRDGIEEIGPQLHAYLSLHAYQQLVMFPYGYSKRKKVKNYEKSKKLAKRMAKAIYKTHGKTYIPGPIATTIYPTSGNSIDWVQDNTRAKYCLIIEERDTGECGFILNRTEIIPTGEEIYSAVKVLGRQLEKEL